MTKVCILDYGSGNVGSVNNLIQFLNYECKISNDPKEIEKSTHIILPGVGAFGPAMQKVKNKIPIKKLKNEIAALNKTIYHVKERGNIKNKIILDCMRIIQNG